MGKHWLVAGIALALAGGPASADMYTWVDKDGVTNISNEAPPEGVRVTKVVRTAPKDPAREAAARQAEVRALRDRVDELSKEVQQTRNDAFPPPYTPAPVMAYAPQPDAPAPTVVVTVVNQPAQQPDVVPASSCDYTFGGCGVGYSPGWAYPGFTYYVPPFRRGFNKPDHHRKWVATPTRQRSLIPPLIPYTMHPPGGRRLG